MKINSINFNNFKYQNNNILKSKLNQTKTLDLKDLYPQNYTNNISFCAKTNQQKLDYIGEENFPNETILKRYKEVIANGEDKKLYQIHSEYYANLLDCETLEEVKEIYPEFSDVIESNSLVSDHKQSIVNKIKENEVPNVTLDNLSLILLQNHYAKMIGINSIEKNNGLGGKTLRKLFSMLNISEINREYMLTMNRETPEYAERVSHATENAWKDPEYRKARSEDAVKRWQREDYRARQIEATKELWKNPEYRKQASERFRKLQETTDLKERQRAAMHKMWSEPESRERSLEQLKAANKKRWDTPGSREKMAEIMRERWQNPEYRKFISESTSKAMKELWKKPEYIEFKRQAMLEKWEDPEFRDFMVEFNTKQWENPEFREKMKVYSDALSLAWEMHPEIKEGMVKVAAEFPGLGKLLTKAQSGKGMTNGEEKLLTAYYKKCHEQMPGFTWIVGQTQKQIIAMWKEQGIIPSED